MLLTISQPIPLTLYSQDSPTLRVRDVTSLKDQQSRPLDGINKRPPQLHERRNALSSADVGAPAVPQVVTVLLGVMEVLHGNNW